MKTQCPNCAHDLTEDECLTDDATPKPDDISICAYCFAILIYDENLNRVEAPLKLQAELLADPDLGPVIRRARLGLQGHLPSKP